MIIANWCLLGMFNYLKNREVQIQGHPRTHKYLFWEVLDITL